MLAIYIRTKNSPNGNPQRGWIIADSDGTISDFVDEGYQGAGALRKAYPHVTPTDEAIEVTPGYYQKAKRSSRS
jgi:hypothetical protein